MLETDYVKNNNMNLFDACLIRVQFYLCSSKLYKLILLISLFKILESNEIS